MDTNTSSQHSAHSEEVFLPYDLNYIPEELQKRAKSELFEDEETRVSSLKLLRSMIRDESNLHWIDDDLYLLQFLRARKFNVKLAFNMFKNQYAIFKKYDEVYGNFNYEDVEKTLEENSFGFLPYRDKEGCVIAVFRAENWNPRINNTADMLRAASCGMAHAVSNPATQIAGIKAIIDCSGCELWKLTYITPRYLWIFVQTLQSCFPARFKAIHVVNNVLIMQYLWNLIKHILSKKLRNRFHFHGKHVKELHESFSPKILPAELGGELPAFDNSDWAAKVAESADYFTHSFSNGYHKKEEKLPAGS